MQSQASQPQMFQAPDAILAPASIAVSEQSEATSAEAAEPIWFRTHFVGSMVMYADAQTVAKYFDAHQDWFRRCAHPMKADPIGESGYALTVGRFGALGYQVEPKVGLDLLPQQDGVYLIKTIAVPNYTPPGYEVDFQAAQTLVEVPADLSDATHGQAGKLSTAMTRVEWKLDLAVGVCLPKFIRALPQSTIQNNGDRLLAQIVKQVSRCLTHKVQEDFHASLGKPALEFFKKQSSQKRNVATCEQCH